MPMVRRYVVLPLMFEPVMIVVLLESEASFAVACASPISGVKSPLPSKKGVSPSLIVGKSHVSRVVPMTESERQSSNSDQTASQSVRRLPESFCHLP